MQAEGRWWMGQAGRASRRASALVLLLFVAGAAPAFSRPSDPFPAARARFQKARRDPLSLRQWLQAFPKGGDLHSHLTGAIYAEEYLDWAARRGACVDLAKRLLLQPSPDGSCPEPLLHAAAVVRDRAKYGEMIDSLSGRNLLAARGYDHEQFFSTFSRFGGISRESSGELIATVVQRAARQGELYLELMPPFSVDFAATAIASEQWTGELEQMRQQVVKGAWGDGSKVTLSQVVAGEKEWLDQSEAAVRRTLGCDKNPAAPGCEVTVRYLASINRATARERFFAQAITAFELAHREPRILGVNVVAPEDGYVSMRDFQQQMEILAFLRKAYPTVRLALHAGELSLGLVPPEKLGTHVRGSVITAGAERIGHGTDIIYDPQADDTFALMAARRVPVEIALSSSELILGIKGNRHPFRRYLAAGVPVVIATDDEGVSRSDLTNEYQKAVEAFDLTFDEVLTISRNSLEYSFLPGTSLWTDGTYREMIAACAKDRPGTPDPTADCSAALVASEKAAHQWKLEAAFADFD